MEEKNPPIIQMTDDNGNTIHAELYDIFDFECRKYALLVPVDGVEEKKGEKSMAVMRLMEDGDSYYIEEIPTDEEFERVSAYLHGPVKDDDKNCDSFLRKHNHGKECLHGNCDGDGPHHKTPRKEKRKQEKCDNNGPHHKGQCYEGNHECDGEGPHHNGQYCENKRQELHDNQGPHNCDK